MPEDCVQFWAPWYKRKLKLLKRVSSVKDHTNYEEIGVPLLWREVERARESFSICINTCKEGTKKRETAIFSGALRQDQRQWGQTEIQEVLCGHQSKKRVFPVRVTEHWDRFPKEIFDSWSLEITESCLDIVVGGLFWIAELEQGLGPGDLQCSLPTSALLWFCCGVLCNYSFVICFISFFTVVL